MLYFSSRKLGHWGLDDREDLEVKVTLIKPFGSSFSTDNDVLHLFFSSAAKICINLFSGVDHLDH